MLRICSFGALGDREVDFDVRFFHRLNISRKVSAYRWPGTEKRR